MNTLNKHMHAVLKRADGATQVSWIPAEFAELGRVLKLKESGEWKDGWVVTQTYPSLLIDSDVIAARKDDYRQHRRATDV